MEIMGIVALVGAVAGIFVPLMTVWMKGLWNTIGKAIDSKHGVNKGNAIFSDNDRTSVDVKSSSGGSYQIPTIKTNQKGKQAQQGKTKEAKKKSAKKQTPKTKGKGDKK